MPVISFKLVIVAHDLLAIYCAWTFSLFARFNFELPPDGLFQASLNAAPVVILAQGLVGGYFGLYRGLWRFTSLPDLWNLLKSAIVGTFVIIISLFVLNRLEYIPRSTIILYPVFLLIFLGGSRLLFRVIRDRNGVGFKQGFGKKVLVIGAGTAGEAVVREMLREKDFSPIGFVDDNYNFLGARIHGVPVLGAIGSIPELVEEMSIDLIVIAVPSASDSEMQRIFEICNGSGKNFLTLPKLNDIVEGRVALREVRALSIDDLLGREQISLDWTAIRKNILGKKILVTGGGGSIGRELCLQICSLNPGSLVVLDQSEYNLYDLERCLRSSYPSVTVGFFLGDICDLVTVENLFNSERPDVVFHAAAYKHVPILERQMRQAIQNNVLGTKALAECAVRHEVENFVLISTDKAVRPSSIMGATKRLAELVCLRMNFLSSTKFITVRFGNVLNSAGSVVPLFQNQIDKGGPVTVTHKEATRFFMSIPESCQLIMEASAIGNGGDLYVLDMGKPVKITYLAEQMIKLSGYTPGEDIQVVFTGLRPGEKIEEELFFEDENLRKTKHDKLLLSDFGHIDIEEIGGIALALQSAVEQNNKEEMTRILEGFRGEK